MISSKVQTIMIVYNRLLPAVRQSHHYHNSRNPSSSLLLKPSTRSRSRCNKRSYTTKPIPIETLFHDSEESSNDKSLIQIEKAQLKLSKAIKSYHDEQKPVLIRNFYNNNSSNNNKTIIQCRALQKWTNLEYLENTIGANTLCYVEIGGSYNNIKNKDSSRPEIPFGEYISYIELFHEQYNDDTASGTIPKNDEIVYMAQNDIDSLRPILSNSSSTTIKDDFIIPQLCHDATHNVGNGQMYSSMFWFGPKYCVSPLHFDPLDNILMQFVGRKKVILFQGLIIPLFMIITVVFTLHA